MLNRNTAKGEYPPICEISAYGDKTIVQYSTKANAAMIKIGYFKFLVVSFLSLSYVFLKSHFDLSPNYNPGAIWYIKDY